MSAARRSILTATAAGTLLAALWFVPNATATPDHTEAAADRQQTTSTTLSTQSDRQLRLADTGTVDTTPYVVGGSAFLGLGVGFVAYSVRRQRAL
ncbi:hypothetical protein [Streptomyces sp. VRA16 Mangrove soil]|uniref:hypothetical protein n=1 Tax=Streptomyces sp. VRA16 Mangrove soil TaxID=2817434 RepID=UPI001A9CCB70|nr:hypothetical protein [Streptomyces sp. VRA16 Mangrove soil]MBO1334741.1 hypothetical protein [Streptomyces sp. VRA16 Mangrove soil]